MVVGSTKYFYPENMDGILGHLELSQFGNIIL
jgi:hypothetical protein